MMTVAEIWSVYQQKQPVGKPNTHRFIFMTHFMTYFLVGFHRACKSNDPTASFFAQQHASSIILMTFAPESLVMYVYTDDEPFTAKP